MVAPRTIQYAISALLLMVVAVSPLVRLRHGTHPVYQPATGLATPEIPELVELRHQGNSLFRAGDYSAAIKIYETAYREAIRRKDTRSALRLLNNLGSANYLALRYRDAVKAYLQARELALSQSDQETLAAIYSNLSSLYDQMGQIDAASESAERGLELPDAAAPKFRSQLLIQSAFIQIRQKNWERAISELRKAIDTAHAQRDTGVEAQAWNELGNALRECDRLPAAETALLEALRLRTSTQDERLHFSYESLGELRLRQNDWASARRFFDQALDSSSSDPKARWPAFYGRGKANLASSQLRAAYADFGEALRGLKRWREEVLPADAFRISSEVEQHEVYSAYIEAASQLYRQTGGKQYATESFAAVEEGRAGSLHALWLESGLTKELPGDYGPTLAALQKAEAAPLSDASNAAVIRKLRLQLMEMETGAALGLPAILKDPDFTADQLLQQTRNVLKPDEAYFGFHAGENEFALWAVTRDAFEFRTVPSGAELSRDIDAFVKAVSERSDGAGLLGQKLYDRLFGSVSARLRQKQTWVLAPDGPLFDLPFAALVEATTGEPHRYLIEGHAVRIVPGIGALLRSSSSEPEELFVGVGDPIYNRADPRWPRARPPLIRSAAAISRGSPGARILELPRLPGSAREIENCARIWRANGRRAILLAGADANKGSLLEALGHDPSVVHVAAHMLFPSDQTGTGMVALGLQADHQLELLSAAEIAGIRATLGLVTLDGCNSGSGPVLPGAGLMGMTRAWLVAGARAVIATRWPATDYETGDLFSSLYQLYFSQRRQRPVSFPKLLREAQLDALRGGGRHSDPAYWATYFCVDRN